MVLRYYTNVKMVRCHKCGYIWQYKGASKFYACCPRCQTKVKLDGTHKKMAHTA